MSNKRFIKETDSIIWQDVPIDLVNLAKSINTPELALDLIKQIDWEQGSEEFTLKCKQYFDDEINKIK